MHRCPRCSTLLISVGEFRICPVHGQIDELEQIQIPEEKQDLFDLLEALPSVLSFGLREYLLEPNPVIKLWYICGVVELTLRLVVALGIADRLHYGELPKSLLQELQRHIEEPTLGKWKNMAVTVAMNLQNKDKSKVSTVFPEIPNLVLKILVPKLDGPSQGASPANSLSWLRSTLAHGGGMSGAVATQLLKEWSPYFEKTCRELAWLREVTLVAKTGAGEYVALRGTTFRGVPYVPENSQVETLLNSAFKLGDEIVVLRGGRTLTIWPLATFGIPSAPSLNAPPAQEASPQVFVRREELSVLYNPIGSEESCLSEGNQEAYEAFLQMFQLDKPSPFVSKFEIQGFDTEIKKMAASFVGREQEVFTVHQTIHERTKGVLWLSGSAGVGKSALISRIAVDLMDQGKADWLILPYLFGVRSADNPRIRFLRFALERLHAWLTGQSRLEVKANDKLLFALRQTLSEINQGRVIFILDGLDELAETDPDFVKNVPLAIEYPNVLWLCSGRPDWDLGEIFSKPPTITLFPDGLPPLGKDAIWSILFETVGDRRTRVLALDTETPEGIDNPFINQIYAYSEGLPLYVKYIAGDINAGIVDPKKIDTWLPKNLRDAHNALLRKCGVSSHHQILTPSASIFTVACEPLGRKALQDLLSRCGFLSGGENSDRTVNKALSCLSSMLFSSASPEERGFTLIHHSLRQFIEQAKDMVPVLSLMREELASLALHPGEGNGHSAPYLYRAGIRHLLDVERYNDSIELLCQFGYLVDRLHTVPNPLGTRGITEDWYRIKQRSESDVSKSAWAVFWHDHAHLLLRGIESWPAWKILIQLALDYSAGGEIAKAVQDWLEDHLIATPWLHLDPRELQTTPLKKAFVFVLEGSLDYVNACAASQDGQLALCGGGSTEYRDYDLRIWDIDKQQIRRVLRGHKREITSVVVSPSASTGVSVSSNGDIRVWNLDNGNCLKQRNLRGAEFRTVAVTPDDKYIVTAGDDGFIRLWDLSTLDVLRDIGKVESGIKSLVVCQNDGQIIAGESAGLISIWNISNGICTHRWTAHPEGILCLASTPDGKRLVSGSPDGAVSLWDTTDQKLLHAWSCLPDSVSAVAITPDGQYVIAGFAVGKGRTDPVERSLKVWDTQTGALKKRLSGHSDSVYDIKVLGQAGRFISASRDGTVRGWDLNLLDAELKTDSDLFYIQTVCSSKDGKRGWMGCGDEAPRTWNFGTHSTEAAFVGHEKSYELAVSPDERILATTGADSTLRLWDVQAGKHAYTIKSRGATLDKVCFSPDGRFVITTPWSKRYQTKRPLDKQARIWCLKSMKCVASIDGFSCDMCSLFVCMSPDGKNLLMPDTAETLSLWSFPSLGGLGQLVRTESTVFGFTFSPDGRYVVCGDEESGKVLLIDIRTRELVRTIVNHPPNALFYIRAVAFTKDGCFLCTGCDDGGLRIFKVKTGELVAVQFFDAWATSVDPIGQTYNFWVGLSNGDHRVCQLENAPTPGRTIVTPVRRYTVQLPAPQIPFKGSDLGYWEDQITVPCYGCGKWFPVSEDSLNKITAINSEYGVQQSPCRELPDSAWVEMDDDVVCPHCGNIERLNPFVVDMRDVIL